MEVDERGDAFRGIPKLWLFGVLRLCWGFHGHPQAQALCHSLFHNPSNPYPKLENFTTQNLNRKSHELRQYKKTNHHLRYCNELILNFLVLNLLYSNFSMVHNLRYQPQIHQNKQTTHEKKESVKNRTVCSNLQLAHDLEPQKF